MSEAVSRRLLPRGVYTGFVPQVSAGSMVLTLAVDDRVRFSSLKVGSQSGPAQVDIFTKEDVTLNFTNHAQFPVYVIARADYARDAHTQARILTRATGATGPQEINICKVDKPAADLIVDTTVPDARHLPVAFSGQAFGYMLPGAAEDIVFAQSVTDEVIQARDNVATPPAPPAADLATRLALDLAASYLAAQLGLRNNALVGNAKIVPATATSVNVSGSFASTSREFEPKMNIVPGGSETIEGAITAPTDAARNLCFLVNEVTGHRVLDADRHPIYGRLEFVSGPTTGTAQFENAQTTVQGSGTLFQDEYQDGDIILGADTNWYEIASRLSQTELELTSAYLGPDASGWTVSFRRFTLAFRTRGTGIEVVHVLIDPVNMRFFFPAWNRADRSVFDALAFMHKVGERPVLGESTDAIAGRIRLAIAGAKAGAIHTVNSGQASIGNNFHTLNFSADEATLVKTGTGVASVVVQGDQGDPGPGAIVGPPGPVGTAGIGLQLLNSFESNGTLYTAGTNTMTIDFAAGSPPMSGSLRHIVGGFARISSSGVIGLTESWRIDDIFINGLLGNIQFTLTGTSTAKFFLGVSQ